MKCQQLRGPNCNFQEKKRRRRKKMKGSPMINQTSVEYTRHTNRKMTQQWFHRHDEKVFLEVRRCCMHHSKGSNASHVPPSFPHVFYMLGFITGQITMINWDHVQAQIILKRYCFDIFLIIFTFLYQLDFIIIFYLCFII